MLAAAVATVGAAGITATSAFGYGFNPDVEPSVELSTGQAGAHPDLTVSLGTVTNARGSPIAGTEQVITELPPGLVGNPSVVATCPMTKVVLDQNRSGNCPREAAVGQIAADLAYPATGVVVPTQHRRVFRLPTNPGEPAAFGTSFIGYAVKMTASVRSDGDYGLTVSSLRVPEGVWLKGMRVTFWGVPADKQGPGVSWDGVVSNPPRYEEARFGGPLDGAPRLAFMSNPSSCAAGPLRFVLGLKAWIEPDAHLRTVTTPAVTGCDQVPFEPSLEVTSASRVAGQPSAYRVDIVTPQTDDATQLSTAHLKDATVALPEGTAISPSVADGLQVCTDQQLGLDRVEREGCPLESKIGSVTVDTPLLPEPMTGSIYQGSQQSSDPRSGEMYRIFLTAAGDGVRIKLRGNISVNPTTGQLTTTFVDNPQLPFNRMSLQFKGGDRAPLVNPMTCGEKTATGTLTGWSGAVRNVSSSFTIDQGCPTGAFGPTFGGGTANAAAGAFAPLVLNLARPDGHQELNRLTYTFPEGVVGMISSVPLCGEAAAKAGTCGEESRIGSLNVATGTGPVPLQLPGRLYMTGAYGGGAFGVAIVVPAIAGPFNLGDVVVRGAIHVDPATARITITTDPLPTITGGVPLHMRAIDVNVDRGQFIFNATNCRRQTIGLTATGTAGGTASPTTPYQAKGCNTLPYRAKLKLTIGGKGKTRQNRTTDLTALLRQPVGQANSKSIDVLLPRSVNARLEALRGGCPLEVYQQERCGTDGLVGDASVVTPVLREPLSGNVYLVRNPARRLPDIMVALRGQVAIDVTGKVRVAARTFQLGTNFDTIPDVPLTEFRMTFRSGPRGLLGIATNLCSKEARRGHAKIVYTSQSLGKRREYQKLTTQGCGLQASAAANRAAAAKKQAAAAKKAAAKR